VTTTSGTSLHAELQAVEQEFPGWHLFASDTGQIWAVTTENHAGGSGTTLEAPSPALMRHEIAGQQHRWHCTCGSAA
jgi:hypothetical protein